MKKILFTLIACLLFSCSSVIKRGNKTDTLVDFGFDNDPYLLSFINKETGILYYPYRYPAEDSVWIDLEILVPQKKIYPLLDSLIDITKTCPGEDGWEHQFSMTCENINNKVYISTTYLPIYEYDYDSSQGYFIYQNNRFNYKGILLEDLVKKSGKLVSFRCVRSDAFMLDGNDAYLYWNYIYQDGILINNGYQHCNEIK